MHSHRRGTSEVYTLFLGIHKQVSGALRARTGGKSSGLVSKRFITQRALDPRTYGAPHPSHHVSRLNRLSPLIELIMTSQSRRHRYVTIVL